jgi:Asp-tRNA(Asn)/Glu-tRNA(Gln) amidotransferase A subunit family amidase
VRETVSLLEDLGHHVDEAAPSVDASMPSILMRLWQTVVSYYQVTDLSQVEPYNRMLAQRALGTSSADYVEAVNALHAASREVVRFWTRYDVFVTSTLVRPRVRAGWVWEADLDPTKQLKRDGEFLPFYTPLANVTGLPAMSLPLAWTGDGLPIGVHLVGAPAGEATLLQLATQLEAARPWSDRRPKGY